MGSPTVSGRVSRLPPALWTPERPPAKRDVWLLGAAVILAWVSLAEAGSTAWPWVAAGFVANALVIGPLAGSVVGRRVGDALRALDPLVGKAVALSVVALVAVVFIEVFPEPIGSAVAAGGCVFIALSLATNAVLKVGRNEATPN